VRTFGVPGPPHARPFVANHLRRGEADLPLDLFSLPLSQAHPRATAIVIDELDTCNFQGASDHFESCSTGLGYSRLHLTNSDNPNARAICKILLSPIEQSAGRPALRRGDHPGTMAKAADSIKSVEKRLTR
jgi:hypothetical protein